MNIHFLFPACFLLIIPVGWALRHWWSRDILRNILRIILALLIITALAQPRLKLEKSGGVLVVVADRSKSMPPGAFQRQQEVIKLLEEERGSRDMVAVVGFAEEVNVEQLPDRGSFDGFKGYYSGNGSRLAPALDTAISLIPKDRSGRILLLTDGKYTGLTPLDAESLGKKRRMPVDYRKHGKPDGADLAIIDLNVPASVEPGEAFQFSADVFVPQRGIVTYRLKRDNQEIAKGKIDFAPGKRQILFQDRLLKTGNSRYTLEIAGTQADSVAENNFAQSVVSVNGGRPILHVGSPNSRLLKLAQDGKLNIEHRDADSVNWSLDGLSKYKAVILENVPASKLGYTGQLALKHFVESVGGGVMISGGRQSFGIGGYYKTPVADIMPVSMELRREHRKLSTAVVVALDRSGSMSISVPDGRTKMDLANNGTASALELLSDSDTLGVLAVDSQAHVIVPAAQISGRRQDMEHRIRSIQSMGGGIFIYEALHHATEMLANIEAGTRHIILFADAADSEEPGAFRQLLKKLQASGITVSVIGLGTEHDCDAELLKEIAALGGGNVYFSNSAMELPQLFAQETLTVFRGAFIEDPTSISKTEDLPLLCDVPMGEPPPLGGYNLCYIRPKALTGLVSKDEYKSPVLAFWRFGSGRCLTFAGEIDGKYTGKFGQWDKSGQIYLSCLRWINNSAMSEHEDIFVDSFRQGRDVTVEIELDPSRQKDPFVKRPRLVHLKETEAGIVREMLPFEWRDKDSLKAKVPISQSGTSHFYVNISKDELNKEESIIPVNSRCLPYAQEYLPELQKGRGEKTLRRLASITSGKERLSFDGIFEEIPPFTRYIPIWHYLALAAVLIVVLEAACRRLGFSIGAKRQTVKSTEDNKHFKFGFLKRKKR